MKHKQALRVPYEVGIVHFVEYLVSSTTSVDDACRLVRLFGAFSVFSTKNRTKSTVIEQNRTMNEPEGRIGSGNRFETTVSF